MTRTDLVKSIQQETNFSASQIEKILIAASKIIIGKVSEGEIVRIKDFGVFSSKERAERKGHNPQTGETLVINACTVPHFKAFKAFKDAVNK